MASDPHDPRDPAALLAGFLSRLDDESLDAATPATRWHVVEVAGGGFGLLADGADEPAVVFGQRQTAFLAAAVCTAFGTPPSALVAPTPEEEAAAEERAIASASLLGEAAEPGYGEPSAPVLSRLVAGLLERPEALELLMQAADPDILAEALALAADKSAGGDDGSDDNSEAGSGGGETIH